LTYLHARTPRVTCPEHGTIQVRLPWAEPLSRFTTRFESWAVDQLSECSVTGAGRLLRTSWDESWGLMARAVARGQAVKQPSAPRHVGVDEKSVGHGQDYITVVSDLDRSTVEQIADERRQSSLDSYFDALTAAQLQSIKAVAMDMWEPYVNSVPSAPRRRRGEARLWPLHIISHLGKAVDTVRKQENRALAADGDKSRA
jgi:transposase